MLGLIILVFGTYLGAATSLGHPDSSRLSEANAIGSLLTRTFDTLFSYVLLFLGLSLSKDEKPKDNEVIPVINQAEASDEVVGKEKT